MSKVCGIYKITSPTGRVYVGQSIDCLHRLKQYKWHRCKKQARLYASILKYGWEKHKSEILQTCEEFELNKLEIYYAELFNVYSKDYGLNLRECGGSRGRHTKESIEKCRASKIGKKKSPEHLAKIIATRKKMYEDGSLVPWNKGLKGVQKCSEETREKRRKSMLGKNSSEAHRASCRLRHKKYVNPLAKTVLNIENGIFYDSVRQVSDTYALNYQVLVNKLGGRATNKTQFIFA